MTSDDMYAKRAETVEDQMESARISSQTWPIQRSAVFLIIAVLVGIRMELVVVVLGVDVPSHSPPMCLLSKSECNELLSLHLEGSLTFSDVAWAGEDYGMVRYLTPAAILHPGSESDIVSVVSAIYSSSANLTIAARGPGHSVSGQSQALHGIVINMGSIQSIVVNRAEMFVESSGGELWVDVLSAALQEGLSPKSFTDYLYLSVGGTLSNAGVSGQAYRFGPQINNVAGLEVITGTGKAIPCSRDENPGLFFAVLGGLGQFGIIAKARINLQYAPTNVRWIRALYSDFALFKQDQEMLIALANKSDAFDYIEGFIVSNTPNTASGYNSVPFPGTGQTVNPDILPDPATTFVLYYIELTVTYDNASTNLELLNEKITRMLKPLNYITTQMYFMDVSYFEFLQRVRQQELSLRELGEWELPHAWLNVFVPGSKIMEFDRRVFKTLTPDIINTGPVICYALNRDKWDLRMSAQVPGEDVFYLVAFLSSVSKTGPSLATLVSKHNQIKSFCLELGCKQYLPTYSVLSDWKEHFGESWNNFVSNKITFDPKAILAPGQNIFGRDHVTY